MVSRSVDLWLAPSSTPATHPDPDRGVAAAGRDLGGRHRLLQAETQWGERVQRVVAPSVSAVLLTAVLVLIATKLDLLTGVGTTGNIIICLPLGVAFLAGLGRGYQVKRQNAKENA